MSDLSKDKMPAPMNGAPFHRESQPATSPGVQTVFGMTQGMVAFSNLTPAALLHLQRFVGNESVTEMLEPMVARQAAPGRTPASSAPHASSPAVLTDDERARRLAQDDGGLGSIQTFQQYHAALASRQNTLFGQSVTGLHRRFLQKLQAAEAALRALRPGAGDQAYWLAWGIHGITGLRAAGNGLHSWGLAVDINYAEAPFLMHESRPGAAGTHEREFDQEAERVYNRISWLMLGRASDIPHEITHGHGRSREATTDAWERLKHESLAMGAYFGMKLPTDPRWPGLIQAFLDDLTPERWSGVFEDTWPMPSPLPPASEIIARLSNQIAQDYAALGGGLPSAPAGVADRPFQGRHPEQGFLDLPEELVVALRSAGLRWGAIDFGPQSGDVMHFDDGTPGGGIKADYLPAPVAPAAPTSQPAAGPSSPASFKTTLE